MKKLIIIPLLIIALCGCEKKETEIKTSGIAFDTKITYENCEYEASAEIYDGGIFSLTLAQNSPLPGMNVTFDGNKMTVNYLGLSYSPSLPMPEENIAVLLNSLIFDIRKAESAKRDKEHYIYEGTCGEYDYSVTFTAEGLPLFIECKEAGLYAEIYNVKIIS